MRIFSLAFFTGAIAGRSGGRAGGTHGTGSAMGQLGALLGNVPHGTGSAMGQLGALLGNVSPSKIITLDELQKGALWTAGMTISWGGGNLKESRICQII